MLFCFLVMMTFKGLYNNNQIKSFNINFRKVLLILIIICGDIHVNPRPDIDNPEVFESECQKLQYLKYLKILHLNTKSIVNKISQLRAICDQTKVYFLYLTES